MESGRRSNPQPEKHLATGAWAPKRASSRVYARRRVVGLAIVVLLIGIPLFLLLRPSGSGDDASLTPSPGDDESAEVNGCREAVDQLSLRSRLALLLMVGLDGDNLLFAEALLSNTDRPGGIFVQSGTAVWEEGLFTGEREDLLPQIVAVDDEGGRVQLDEVLDEIPAAAALIDQSAADVESAAADRGEALRDLGIDVTFAPVVDVGGGGGIGDRSFSDDPEIVSTYAGAYVSGLQSSGVLPVLKHFPGHGRASGDSHDGAVSTPPLDELRTVDLLPYERLIAEPPVGVMIGHLDVPGFTEAGVPASISPAAVGLLRGSYEFDGIVFTDDLVAMDAVADRFSVPEAVERALIAGVDMPLLARDTDVGAVLDQLTEAVQAGRLTEARVSSALDRIVVASGCETTAG